MWDKMQTETSQESTNNKDMLILILSAVQHTKEEITENGERVSNLTERAQQRNENREECRRAKTERERIEQRNDSAQKLGMELHENHKKVQETMYNCQRNLRKDLMRKSTHIKMAC
jgi:hypothetical protein